MFIEPEGTLIAASGADGAPDAPAIALHVPQLAPGAAQALGALSRAGFALVLLSYRRGALPADRSQADVLRRLLRDDVGVAAEAQLACPHAPGPRGDPACGCRRPEPGLLLEAAQLHGLDLRASWLVGDTPEAVEAGHRAGCRAILFRRGPGGAQDAGGARRSLLGAPDAACADWPAVLAEIDRARTGPSGRRVASSAA